MTNEIATPAAQPSAEPRRTPLYDAHVAAGARMVDFAGWLMPLEYPGGSLAEHAAVRGSVGIFDVSHMGRLALRGPGAVAALNAILAADLQRITAGQAQYTLLCNEAGGIVDDLICYRVCDDEAWIVPNASNAGRVITILREALPASVELVDRSAELAMVAVQGPASPQLLAGLDPALAALAQGSAQLEYMHFAQTESKYGPVFVARSGYTGERGYELLVPAHRATELWADLGAAGASPAGLGVRDILRLEMGYPLHGNDLSPQISALESGMAWVIGWDKPAFLGRSALVAQRQGGRTRGLRGLLLTGRGVPRPGMPVLADGTQVGTITSGTFSPTLRTGIALALVDAAVGLGAEVEVGIRSRNVPGVVTRPPFVPSSPR